jgi:hypothetical protein
MTETPRSSYHHEDMKTMFFMPFIASWFKRGLAAVLAAAAIGCGNSGGGTSPAVSGSPAEQFMASLNTLCGQAFAGRIVANTPPQPGDPFEGQRLVMHVWTCDSDRILIPFHVGDDRSRTWVLTRHGDRLRLKHDHRHADGTPDVMTEYGGDTTEAGTSSRQVFPADEESRALFTREGRAASNANVWAMEVHAGDRFVYELTRSDRTFRVEFDLRVPVTPPPAPWGK